MGVVRLLGHHIGHSASPAMHNAAFAALGRSDRYELADVAPDALPAAVAALRNNGALGANVTVPYKGAVIDVLDDVDPLAARAGAVNTIIWRDGRLVGSNTDVPALVDEIKALRATPRLAIVLGNGGAARAVRLALELNGGADVVLVSRSDWERLPGLLADADLLVNATPVGMGADETPVPADLLRPDLAVLDLVYRPSPTRLVREARGAGAPARGGAGVLLGQGWRSLEAWLEMPVPPAVRATMADALRGDLGAGADV
jgi:shikimate dehydrogenase